MTDKNSSSQTQNARGQDEKKIKIGINGFGRIGRCIARALAYNPERYPFDLVMINDLTDTETLAHLFNFDSVHGRFTPPAEASEKSIKFGGFNPTITAETDPARIPWSEHGVELVLECTGLFTEKPKAGKHIRGSVKRVLISAPSKDADATIVFGVNHETLSSNHTLVSCGSCTTNCLAPVAATVHKAFGILRGSMTTVHSYTNDQRILDLPHKDLRRARAAAVSMIPTSTGAAKAIGLVIPELAGKLDGLAIRVPTPNVSLLDLVCEVKKETSTEELRKVLADAAAQSEVLEYCTKELVSVDFMGSPKSSVVDAESCSVIGKNLVKVLAWYDNESGFSNRMLDVATLMARL